MAIIHFEQVEDKILHYKNEQIILDYDIAELYGVETKRINEAVSNNPEKFPAGYVLNLTAKEWKKIKINQSKNLLTNEIHDLRSKFSTAKFAKMRVIPKAFTERGLYMLATILKSPQAIQTTIAIIDTFYKIRSLSRQLQALPDACSPENQQSLLQKSNQLIGDLLNDHLRPKRTLTTLELNLALLKVKHSIIQEVSDD